MKRLALALTACLLAAPAPAHEGHDHEAGHEHMRAPGCADPKPECAATATPAFGADGRLWLTYSVAGKVYVASSRDAGAHFDPPAAVPADPVEIDDNGEARPTIVAAPDGTLVVAYAQRLDRSYNGKIFISRSTDGGKSFSPPRPLLESSSQRFAVLAATKAGRIYVAWLDKGNQAKAKAAGEHYVGSGVAMAWSDDRGATFSGKRILIDHSCECCRVAMALDTDQQPVVAWRHVFGANLRDHMVAKLSPDGSTFSGGRVSQDQWAIDACPHQGPALAVDAKGVWHVAWYTAGKARKGLFYARSADGGRSFSEPEKIGVADHVASHAQILASNGALYRAWKDFDGVTTTILTQVSLDDGRSWSAPKAAASTADASDNPLLAGDGKRVYLSWLTRKEGYRLLPLIAGAER